MTVRRRLRKSTEKQRIPTRLERTRSQRARIRARARSKREAERRRREVEEDDTEEETEDDTEEETEDETEEETEDETEEETEDETEEETEDETEEQTEEEESDLEEEESDLEEEKSDLEEGEIREALEHRARPGHQGRGQARVAQARIARDRRNGYVTFSGARYRATNGDIRTSSKLRRHPWRETRARRHLREIRTRIEACGPPCKQATHILRRGHQPIRNRWNRWVARHANRRMSMAEISAAYRRRYGL